MANSSNLEVRFLSLKKEIERYAAFGDYEQTMRLVEQALPLCEKIYDETGDPQKKDVMRENAKKLKHIYETSKARAGGDDDLTVGASAKPDGVSAPVKRGVAPAPARPKKADKTPGNAADGAVPNEKKDGDIQYVFNGVNVEEFLVKDSNETVTFADVVGMEEEKALIEREFFLTDEEREFNEFLGKKSKTFILLYGVPGTGKTFFAKAISQELKNRSAGDVPFFSVVGSQLSDCKVGATEKNIQAVFSFCKQFDHCVLFIDEFDTLAPDRKQANGDPTAGSRVTVLLQMMDGFASAKGTLVIAATNCPYNLDGAILSRANTRIEVPLPDHAVICGVLRAKIGANLAEDVDIEAVAKKLRGYSNRDIKNFVEAMKDMLADEFRAARRSGDNRAFNDFCYTDSMIGKAMAKIVPTTKQSDIDRIAKFRISGE